MIETVNIHPAQAVTFFGATSAMRVVERLSRLDDQIFEYACHEGNYAMANGLSGARDKERRKGAKP